MSQDPETLIYMYGIVDAGAEAPPEELRGIDEGPVRLEPVGDIAAVIGTVPAEVYSDEALNARMDDLSWVGDRGLAHERVLDWFAERGPVIPLSLFSLHHDLERLRDRIGREASDFARILDRLRGRREWGVKLWRREAAAREGIDELSVSLKKMAEEIEAAPPGKRFLLERKRETMRVEELRAASKRLAHEAFSALHHLADDGTAMSLPATPPGGESVLLLHAAFLVSDERFEDFHRGVSEQAKRLTGSGFEIELTGPWPPYHFTDPD